MLLTNKLIGLLGRTEAIGRARLSPLLRFRALAREVVLAPELSEHAAAIVLSTHPAEPSAPEAVRRYVRYGASPRGAQALVLGAKIRALRAGRAHVDFKDLESVALPTLRHRLILSFEGEADGITPDAVVKDALAAVR